MKHDVIPSKARETCTLEEETYDEVCRFLEPFIKSWVYHARLSLWIGQESDVAQDILQESIIKLFKFSRNNPVQSWKRLSLVTARNCFIDAIRKDSRYERLVADIGLHNQKEVSEEASTNMIKEELFQWAAQEIQRFPHGQRVAILSDLAQRMHFGMEVTPLQQAFLDAGMLLQSYQSGMYQSRGAYQRAASLRSHAYRRLRELSSTWSVVGGDAR